MKVKLFPTCLALLLPSTGLWAEEYLISTPSTSLLLSAKQGEKAYIQYYGSRIEQHDMQNIFDCKMALYQESYPSFGINSGGEKALAVTFPDGNMSVDLMVESVKQYRTQEADITEIVLKDKIYPFTVKQYFKAYQHTDIISTWTELINEGKKRITLYRFASAYLPFARAENWLVHYHGVWGAEHEECQEQLTNGQKVLASKEGLRNSREAQPSLMLSMDGRPQEESGRMMGATLVWSGNYVMKVVADNKRVSMVAGINEETSHYQLAPREKFTTPELAMAYSSEGKGGISRAFHRWARHYMLNQGNVARDILLNSWEGVYFKVSHEVMDQMMKDMADMGGELFVMDDGWFGDKYPRNNGSTSLGDWMVCKEKLPQGIEGLTASARRHGIKFGIWIEPEMCNTQSELFEKHPDWVLSQDNRPLSKGRGGTQVVLDMSNPEVQEFVFGVVDGLLSKHPEIAYIKWDANSGLMNYGSHYLPADKQSHLYIDYHLGLKKVLQRIRAKYPKVIMQDCASGGSRVNYGLLPYFNEFWTSDNTDALQRIYMQWGVSGFYPAIAMASHVSANKNHQTGRIVPLKYRFDVAMSGRLGMEIQPKDMSDYDKAFARRAIASYKQVRDIVQLGDLYRLISPYDKRGVASLMYANEEKSQAVLFVYKTEHMLNQVIPPVRLTGIDPNKYYRMTDLTAEDENKPCVLHGKVISGKILKENGLLLRDILNKEYSSLVLELTAVNE